MYILFVIRSLDPTNIIHIIENSKDYEIVPFKRQPHRSNKPYKLFGLI